MEKYYDYDLEKYGFVSLFQELFGREDLENLHTDLEKEYDFFSKPGSDSDTRFHRVFYDKMRAGWPEFLEAYKSLIREEIVSIVGAKDELMAESETGKENRDIMEFVISPDEAIEIKLEMIEGSFVKYNWETKNGGLNYNLHGDGYKGSQKSITYKKGRMASSDSGEIISEFDGYHGWFWRNRNSTAVTVTLETIGDYIQIKKLR